MRKFAALAILLALAGCRREDFRVCVVELPGLRADAQTTQSVVKAISIYRGVDLDSLEWDFDTKTLKVRYDSMQLAEANLRYAIEEAGVKVRFPKKLDKHAGH